jgi:hypothetical protein
MPPVSQEPPVQATELPTQIRSRGIRLACFVACKLLMLMVGA